MATLADVPVESLYIKSVRSGSVVATVGVYATYEDEVAQVLVGDANGGSVGAEADDARIEDLSESLGVPVESVRANGMVDGGRDGSDGDDYYALVMLLVVAVIIVGLVLWRWKHDRCGELTEGKHSDVEVTGRESQPPPPPPPISASMQSEIVSATSDKTSDAQAEKQVDVEAEGKV